VNIPVLKPVIGFVTKLLDDIFSTHRSKRDRSNTAPYLGSSVSGIPLGPIGRMVKPLKTHNSVGWTTVGGGSEERIVDLSKTATRSVERDEKDIGIRDQNMDEQNKEYKQIWVVNTFSLSESKENPTP
jgi:hypothetical protein